jgi:hypothetical protein
VTTKVGVVCQRHAALLSVSWDFREERSGGQRPDIIGMRMGRRWRSGAASGVAERPTIVPASLMPVASRLPGAPTTPGGSIGVKALGALAQQEALRLLEHAGGRGDHDLPAVVDAKGQGGPGAGGIERGVVPLAQQEAVEGL